MPREWYILEHLDVLEQIPDGAQVVLLPQDDPERLPILARKP